MPTRSQHIHTNIQVSFLGNRRRGEHHPVQVIVSSCCPCELGSRRHEFETYPLHRQSWPTNQGRRFPKDMAQSHPLPTTTSAQTLSNGRTCAPSGPRAPHQYQMPKEPCETARIHVQAEFQQQFFQVTIKSSHNRQPRDRHSQTPDDTWFIITASPSPDPLPVIVSGIRGVNPVFVCRRIDRDDVHMGSKQQWLDVFGALPLKDQGIGVHFGAFEVRVTGREPVKCTGLILCCTHTFGKRDSRYLWNLVSISHRGSSDGSPRSS